MSSWWIVSFIIIKPQSLSLTIFFFSWSLFCWYKYGLSCFSLNTICLEYLFHLFSLSLCLSLDLRWVSWQQHIVGSCFLIHPATLSLVSFIYLHRLGWLLIYEDLLLTFYLYFSPIALYLFCFFSLVILSAKLVWWFSIMTFPIFSFLRVIYYFLIFFSSLCLFVFYFLEY